MAFTTRDAHFALIRETKARLTNRQKKRSCQHATQTVFEVRDEAHVESIHRHVNITTGRGFLNEVITISCIVCL